MPQSREGALGGEPGRRCTVIETLKLLKTVIEWALPLIPDADLKAHLSDTARRIDDKIADLVEAAKFGA